MLNEPRPAEFGGQPPGQTARRSAGSGDLSLAFYFRCTVLDVIGVGIREFAFTILILTMVDGPTIGLVTKQAVLALVYVGSLAAVSCLRIDHQWRMTAFLSNITMTALSLIAAAFAFQGSLTYSLILAHAAISGVCAAVSSGPSARLRHFLGGCEQLKLAWLLDANGYVGKIFSGLVCLAVLYGIGSSDAAGLRNTATAFLVVDALLSFPIGWFYFRLACRKDEAVNPEQCRVPRRNRVSLLRAAQALWRIRQLRTVFAAEMVKGLFLSIPFVWQILRFRHGVDDYGMAMLTLGLAVAGLVGNTVGARFFTCVPRLRRPMFRLLVLLMPCVLLATAQAANGWWFVGGFLLFTTLSSPVDSLSDAWLVHMPEALAARIAEIRGTFNSTIAPLGRVVLSWLTLEYFGMAADSALAVLALGAVLLFLFLYSWDYFVSHGYELRLSLHTRRPMAADDGFSVPVESVFVREERQS
jgi:hypothetical protein